MQSDSSVVCTTGTVGLPGRTTGGRPAPVLTRGQPLGSGESHVGSRGAKARIPVQTQAERECEEVDRINLPARRLGGAGPTMQGAITSRPLALHGIAHRTRHVNPREGLADCGNSDPGERISKANQNDCGAINARGAALSPFGLVSGDLLEVDELADGQICRVSGFGDPAASASDSRLSFST